MVFKRCIVCVSRSEKHSLKAFGPKQCKQGGKMWENAAEMMPAPASASLSSVDLMAVKWCHVTRCSHIHGIVFLEQGKH